MRISGIALAIAAGCAAMPAFGQDTPDFPRGQYAEYRLDSGLVLNRSDNAEVVYQDLVGLRDADWIRIYFGEVLLDKGSYIRVTSLTDNDQQILRPRDVRMWNNTTAYFNGNTLLVELIAGADTERNRLTVEYVAYEPVNLAPERFTCGICGADDRSPSNVDWSGRLLPSGCTASVYTVDSCLVSAGHCMHPDNVIQFNVPPSDGNCSLNMPSAADQFPVTEYIYSNGGVGDDWAVMLCGENYLGQQPYHRYMDLRPLASSPASGGETVSVWGFGVDNQCQRSQRQQNSSGQIQARFGSYYTWTVDTPGGCSGSGAIVDGEIVGIVSHCSCNAGGFVNFGTRIDLASFAAAREDLCSSYCTANAGSDNFEFISRVVFEDIDHESGPSTYSNFSNISTEVRQDETYGFALELGDAVSSDIGGLWIDWNADSDFNDAGETITTDFAGTGPYVVQVSVPTGVPVGPTRLRVRIQDGDVDPNLSACGDSSYGEVEDYALIVLEPYPPPANDDCENASPIGSGTFAFETYGATTDGPDEPGDCNFGGFTQIGSDIWYRMFALCTGTATVETCGSDFDTKIAVYGPDCPIGSGETIACDDDSCGQGSSVSFPVTQGNWYLLRIGGRDDARGTGMLAVTCEPTLEPCPEDLDGNGLVDVSDLLELLGAWDGAGDADLNADGVVDVTDLLQLLGAWGDC